MSEGRPATGDQLTEEVPYWPMSRSADRPFDPPPEVRALAAQRPLTRVRIWDDSTPWLVTGHAEQRALLSDPRVSIDHQRPGYPHWNEGVAKMIHLAPRTLVFSDPPEHTRLRRMLTPAFTTKRVEALVPKIQASTDELIDAMLAGSKPADLVTALALPLPSLMICGLLGVPYEDHEFFQHSTTMSLDRYATAESAMAAGREIAEYMVRLVEERIAKPAADQENVLSDLAVRVRAGDLTVHEAASTAQALLSAGHETSANMIALGTLALLEQPDQLAILRDTEDPKVIADAVEELLRYLSIIHNGQRRVAIEDIEIGDELIRAGEGIIIELASANWDPKVFPEPEQLKLSRSAREHHAFGFGIHQCIGQQLARVELRVVYPTLFKRVPTLKLFTTVDNVEFKHDRLAYGVYELPVTW
jgi:cytochrome P450